jgi:CheY-like chemotaxis protein
MTATPRTALVVEDNMLIAMEAEEILQDLGYADCHVCGSVRSALQIIGDHPISFALLDIDLGDESSAAIAARLKADGVPFVFASGYDEFPELGADLDEVPVVTKPYTGNDIAKALKGFGL